MKVLAITLVLLALSPAYAGSRPLELLIVNMTPDGMVTDDGRQCLSSMVRVARTRYAGGDGVDVMRLGESALLREAGRTDPRDFMEWPASALEPVQDRDRDGDRLDAVALIDCRPDSEMLDIMVVSPARGAARIRLRGSISERRARWASARMLDHAWVGFSP